MPNVHDRLEKMARLPHLQGRYYPQAEEAKAPAAMTPPIPEASATPHYAAEPAAPAAAHTSKPILLNAPRPNQRWDCSLGVYVPKGEADPHVYSEYSVREDKISNPRLLRLTTPSILLENSLQVETGLPIACVWQPLAELGPQDSPISVVDASKKGPVRCSRCLAYANPFFVSYDSSRTITCNMCGLTQPMPVELVSEREYHFELTNGTVDFLVPDTYITKPPQLNIFFICVDISADSIEKSIPQSVLTSLKSVAEYIPSPERSRICVMTYSDSFTYYRPSATLQEVVVREVDEPFVADPVEGLSFALDSQMDIFSGFIDALVLKISSIAKPAKELISPAAVITAAKEALGNSGGRVLLFTSGLGTLGLLKLASRDDTRLYNTEKENTLYIPQSNAIYELARDCSTAGITIDVFACAAQPYLDISSIYPLVTITCGDLHYYPHFSPFDAEKMHFTIARILTRPQAFQVLMRARCSNGLTVDSYIGHYNRKGATDMEAAILDSDKAFTVLLKHEEKLKEGGEYYLQCAMLHTSLVGQRMIRVSNTVVRASAQVGNLYAVADVNTVHNVLMKMQLMKLLDQPLKTIREEWHGTIVNFLMCYRQKGNHQVPPGQLAYPENLDTLPLCTIATMKQPAFSLNRVGPDARMASVARLKGMPVITSFLMSYPRIYSIHDMEEQEHNPGSIGPDGLTILPNLVPANSSKLAKNGVYLMDNGALLYLLVGPETSDLVLTDLFGVATVEEVSGISALPDLSSDLSSRLQAILNELHRKNPGAYQALQIVADTAPRYLLCSALMTVRHLLVEDPTTSEMNYNDYLVSLNRVLINKLENR